MGKRLEAALASVAARQLGVITRMQLTDLGMSERTIDGRIASGRLYRRFPGVYVLPGAPRTWEQDLLVAQLSAGGDSAVAGLSAGRIWQIEGVATTRAQIIVPYGRGRTVSGVDVRRTRTLTRGDIVLRPPFRVTSPARTIIDLAGILDRDPLEDALDDVLRRKLTRYAVLHDRVEQLGHGVAGIGTLRELLTERSRGRTSDSSLENRFRRRLRAAGLPEPVAQYEVRHGGRFIARVDFAYVEQRIALEVDGYAFHSGRKRWELDIVRQNRLVAAGWLPVRVTTSDVDGDGSALALIAKTLGGATRLVEGV